jgi:hypothetical protein
MKWSLFEDVARFIIALAALVSLSITVVEIVWREIERILRWITP